jgi:hypothetical protein
MLYNFCIHNFGRGMEIVIWFILEKGVSLVIYLGGLDLILI